MIKRRVVVARVRTADESVIRDDRDVVLSRAFGDIGKRFAVNCGDNERIHSLRDHVLELRNLSGNIVLGVLQVDVVTELLKALFHVSTEIGRASCRERVYISWVRVS